MIGFEKQTNLRGISQDPDGILSCAPGKFSNYYHIGESGNRFGSNTRWTRIGVYVLHGPYPNLSRAGDF